VSCERHHHLWHDHCPYCTDGLGQIEIGGCNCDRCTTLFPLQSAQYMQKYHEKTAAMLDGTSDLVPAREHSANDRAVGHDWVEEALWFYEVFEGSRELVHLYVRKLDEAIVANHIYWARLDAGNGFYRFYFGWLDQHSKWVGVTWVGHRTDPNHQDVTVNNNRWPNSVVLAQMPDTVSGALRNPAVPAVAAAVNSPSGGGGGWGSAVAAVTGKKPQGARKAKPKAAVVAPPSGKRRLAASFKALELPEADTSSVVGKEPVPGEVKAVRYKPSHDPKAGRYWDERTKTWR
jgi:hypothetical protein